MKKLIKKLEAERASKDIKVRMLERLTGTDRCVIEDGLSGKTKEMKLENFIAVASNVYEDYSIRKEEINKFILLCKKDLNIVKAFCYCQGQGEYDVISKLIEKHQKTKTLKKYLTIFELYNQRNLNKKTGKELEKALDEQTFSKLPECQVLVNMLYGFAMYDIPNCLAIIPYSEKVKEKIPSIENKFIRDCLEMQYKERNAYIKLLSDEVEASRKACWDIIDMKSDYQMIKASAYCCLGESYQYKCLKTSEKYILKAIEVLEKNKIDKKSKKYVAFKTTLGHIYIDNAFNIEKIEHEYLDVGEEAHYQLKFGDAELGEKLYSEMKMTPHRKASYAKVKGDILALKEVLLAFERSGNLFYANGIKREILKDEVK
ncbi:AimR family lysis-lysogeny pheromone receptor [Bacillus toyonensis]|uniref:AimR family lysis-lysogeny pheromone receptor n=1 Tax=Bacillus toyonensis TaxID=155322 RepID=UPI0034652141